MPVRPQRQYALRLLDPALATAASTRARNKGANGQRVRTASVEAKARRAWRPGMTVGQLHLAAGISRNAASKHRRIFIAEAQPAPEEVAQLHTISSRVDNLSYQSSSTSRSCIC